jgi:hypothetical protein
VQHLRVQFGLIHVDALCFGYSGLEGEKMSERAFPSPAAAYDQVSRALKGLFVKWRFEEIEVFIVIFEEVNFKLTGYSSEWKNVNKGIV